MMRTHQSRSMPMLPLACCRLQHSYSNRFSFPSVPSSLPAPASKAAGIAKICIVYARVFCDKIYTPLSSQLMTTLFGLFFGRTV